MPHTSTQTDSLPWASPAECGILFLQKPPQAPGRNQTKNHLFKKKNNNNDIHAEVVNTDALVAYVPYVSGLGCK